MGVSLTGIVPAKEIELRDLSGKTIGIDAFNTLYQFLSIIRQPTGEPLRDSQGRITSHLSGLFYRTAKLIEVGIKPVYVFDGEPPHFKKQTVEERIKVREEAYNKWKEYLEKGDTKKARMYAQGALRLNEEMIEESKKLLDFMGISWVQAPSEGEAQAAFLVDLGKFWGVGSQDWDSLLFGAKRLVRNITITGKRKLPRKEAYIEIKPEVIELDHVLSSLEISREQLIIIGILVGTDYNPGGVKGIGPKKALELVKEKKDLERVLEGIKWEFDIQPQEIFDFFKNPPVKEMEIKKNELKEEELKELMVKEHDFSEERVEKVINILKESEKKGKQTSLGSWLKS